MQVTILPLDFDDIPLISDQANRAFRDDGLIKAMLPIGMTSEQHIEYTDWRNNLTADRMKIPNSHYFKAVDSSGRIVGWIGWQGPKPADYVATPRYGAMPDFVKKVFMEDVAKKLKIGKEEVLGGKGEQVWYLQSLTVDPNFQRQGIASQMVLDGLDRLVGGGDCFVESSPVAAKMYERLGFEKRADVPILDDEKYVIRLMVRPGRAGIRKLT